MRQLALEIVEQSQGDWMFLQAEEWGIDLRNDPNRNATIARLIDATPGVYRDAQAAMLFWLNHRYRELLRDNGIREKRTFVQEGQSVQVQISSQDWQQLPLPGYKEWEAQNILRMGQDKAAIEARVLAQCNAHPEWDTTPKKLYREIAHLADHTLFGANV